MKRNLFVVLVLGFVVMLGACSTGSWFDQQIINYNNSDKIIQTAECVISIAEPLPVLAAPVIPVKATKIKILEPVMFDFDKSNIRADQKPVINKVSALMTEYPDTILVLEGHASTEGTDAYNLALSQRRANSVKAALIASGIKNDRIVNTIGKGETSIFGDILKTNRRVMVLSVE